MDTVEAFVFFFKTIYLLIHVVHSISVSKGNEALVKSSTSDCHCYPVAFYNSEYSNAWLCDMVKSILEVEMGIPVYKQSEKIIL